jgi:sec-independent protein translocase protein TatA
MELFTPGHLLVLAIVAAVLFFGWKQLPDMARSLGRSLRIFKTEIKGMTEDDKARDAAKATPAVEAAPPAPVPPATAVTPVTPVPPAVETPASARANGTSADNS